MWMLSGLCLLSNPVCVISACWQYLCSSFLLSSLTLSLLSAPSLPLLYEAIKRTKSGGVNRRFTLLLSWQAGELKKVGRGGQSETGGEAMRVEKRGVGGKESVLCLQLLSWLRGWRTECALCNTVCAFVWVSVRVFLFTRCVLQLGCCMHTAKWVHKFLNALAWLFVKKRSHAVCWRALFCQWDGGSIDLNTKSMFHTEEMRLLSLIICSDSTTAQITWRDLMTQKNA